ncbi:MAG: hypothetical protein IPK82_33200 [Polyangiaceae bacterium]|nr:hypothetical protein [Polyangiaceae bacterium]
MAIVSALGLLITAWQSYRSAVSLLDTVNDGQGERMMRALRQHTLSRGGPVSKEQLVALFEAEEHEGVLGVGVMSPNGKVETCAGKLSDAPSLPSDFEPGPHVRRIGDILRLYAPGPRELEHTRGGRPFPAKPERGDVPPNGEPFPPPGEPPHGEPFPPPGEPPHGGPRQPPHKSGAESPIFHGDPGARVVIEMEPMPMRTLLTGARQTVWLSSLAALVLVGAATLLWRRAGREAALAAQLSQNERLASIGTMSAVIAHEIKNPLSSLKGNAQLLAESHADGTLQRTQADRVVDAAVRLQTLVTNLLDFARTGEVNRTQVDPGEVLFLAACEAAPQADLNLDRAPAKWSLDAARMGQVFENLLRNAEQASPGKVSAEMSAARDDLVIQIRDKGPGFLGDPEAFFELYTTTKSRGTGLGLAVARRIVELHGGTVRARNLPNGGAELTVTIPATAL